MLTTLRRIGSPVVRYRTGDLVRARIPGSTDGQVNFLELEGGILGRVDDMIIVRGVNIYPSAVEQIVQSCNGIVEYRVTWDASKEMVELSFEVEASPEAAVELNRRLEHGLGIRVNVNQVPVGTLPRFEFKAQRWRRLGNTP